MCWHRYQGIFAAAALGGFTLLAAADTAELRGEALITALQRGGYTLYFRHAATDWSQQDHVVHRDDWLSCDPTRVRQLSGAGRDSARALGEAIRALQIPVGRVLASPYCRTVETARLMALGEVRSTDAVINMRVADYFGGRAAVIASAQALLAEPPAAGTNTVIVAHGNVARDATPVYPAEGEGLVFEADGAGGFGFVGRLAADEWAALAGRPR